MEIVSSPVNPCKSFWDEYISGKLTLEEFNTAVYSFAMTDPKCDYRHKSMPFKPVEIRQAEDRLKERCSALGYIEKKEAHSELMNQLRKLHVNYFREVDGNALSNKSNFYFLKEMLAFFETRNQAFVLRVQNLLRSHEAARYEEGFAA